MPPLRFSCRQPGAVLAASPAALRCARVAVEECLSYKNAESMHSILSQRSIRTVSFYLLLYPVVVPFLSFVLALLRAG